MLTDEEAEAIRKGLAEGYRGPVLLKWLVQLLQDREQRRQREREAGAPASHQHAQDTKRRSRDPEEPAAYFAPIISRREPRPSLRQAGAPSSTQPAGAEHGPPAPAAAAAPSASPQRMNP